MRPTSSKLLEVTDLVIALPDPQLLIEAGSFSVRPGEMLWITGTNGAGKTSLLRALLGLLPKKRGKIHWHVSGRLIQYVPQLANSAFSIPVTLGDVLDMQGDLVLEAPRLLEGPLLERAWNTASGGERKRALLERALRKDPRVLILDEPFNHLDRASRDVIAEAVAEYLRRQEGAVVAVSHDAWPEGKFKGIAVKRVEL